MIQKAAVAVGRLLELADEPGELLHVEVVQPGVLGNLLRLAAVMRQLVMPLGDIELRVGDVAAFAAHHQREHPGQVRLEGHCHDVEQQTDMLRIRRGNAERRIEVGDLRAVLLFRALDPAFDLADVVEIVAEAGDVAGAEARVPAPSRLRESRRECCGLPSAAPCAAPGSRLARKCARTRPAG